MLPRGVLLFTIMSALAFAGPAAAEDTVTRETLQSGGQSRSYFLYVPDTVEAGSEVPLLILLHGSKRDGKTVVDPWKAIAKRERLILAGPNATNPVEWHLENDSPYFIADLVTEIGRRHRIDSRRVYLFGHSAGAVYGLMLAVLESEYFAAVGVHAGALAADMWSYIDMADRKIPIGIWVGTKDPFFPVDAVRATKTALEAKALPVHLRTIPNHTHNYYSRAAEVNGEIWQFFSKHRLSSDPTFKHYDLSR
jgi:poly(3-hydroxybutyrate) depolymerase